ncbi:hypothetical protein JOC85_000879 [Bacillus mesophilus]|nr:hypothetical protein [Bacillus mesophilus]
MFTAVFALIIVCTIGIVIAVDLGDSKEEV